MVVKGLFAIISRICLPPPISTSLVKKWVVRKWWSPFFSIKNFKSRKAVVELFLSFKSFKRRKKMAESFFSGHASLSFHMMHKFPGTIFFLSVPTEFLWL